jgi:hypothetical protein
MVYTPALKASEHFKRRKVPMVKVVTSTFKQLLRVAGFAGMMALVALVSTQRSAQAQSTDNNEILRQLLAGASKGTATFPIVFCWYKGQPALYIQTDASDPGLAAQQRVNLVPRLANAINASGGAVDDIYHVTNFQQGNVIPSAPLPAGPNNSDPNYTPMWQLSTVTWNTGTTPRLLTSEEDVLEARDNGEVTLTKTNIVLNCPVIFTPQGGKLPLVKIHLSN